MEDEQEPTAEESKAKTKTKKESMIADRVTVEVRYPLSGGVPTLDATVDALTGSFHDMIEDTESTYDATVVVVSKSRRTVRVPIAEPEELTDDG
jgi:hypothetical protein